MDNLNSKNIFILDAMGSDLSFRLTALLLPSLSSMIGIPKNTLYFLAIFPFAYSLYSFVCYKLPARKSWMLLGIVLANSLYVVISGFVLLTSKDIKLWGYLFLSAEILVLIVIIATEWYIYRKMAESKRSI